MPVGFPLISISSHCRKSRGSDHSHRNTHESLLLFLSLLLCGHAFLDGRVYYHDLFLFSFQSLFLDLYHDVRFYLWYYLSPTHHQTVDLRNFDLTYVCWP